MPQTGQIWKVRITKPYPEAQSHLLVGKVMSHDNVSIRMLCKTFHYGRIVNSPKDVFVGPLTRRIIPWSKVEIINELTTTFDYQNARLTTDGKDNILLSDGHNACSIIIKRNQLS